MPIFSAFEAHDCTSQKYPSSRLSRTLLFYQTIMYAYPEFSLQLQINRLGVAELSGKPVHSDYGTISDEDEQITLLEKSAMKNYYKLL